MQEEGLVRVLIVDDHELLRSGIRVILKRSGKIETVGEAATAAEALEIVEEKKPDVIVLDIKLPDMNGIDLTAKICQKWPDAKILVISADLLKYLIDQSVSAGAQGAMLKDSVFAELVHAIEAISKGKRYFCSRVKEIIAVDWAGRLQTDREASISTLNTREREIVKLLSDGLSVREIADKVKRSPKTVDANRRIIMKKLNIISIPELVKFAISEGLTTVD